MPLYDTRCRSCGAVEEEDYRSVDDVLLFSSGAYGFPCSCGGEAAIVTTGKVRLPQDNLLPADMQGERLTTKQFHEKYGEDAHPVEPGSPLAKRQLDKIKAHNHGRAMAAGYRDSGHMYSEVRRRQNSRRS
jgi:hypothetical protein